MKFYVATSLDRAEAHAKMVELLAAHGDELTYNWTLHGAVEHLGRERMREVAAAELDGVRNADYVVVLLPGGRGTHVELGAALALGKPVFIYAEGEQALYAGHATRCAFYEHPGVVVGLVAAASGYAALETLAAIVHGWKSGPRRAER